MVVAVFSITAAATAPVAPDDQLWKCNATTAAFALTLPSAALMTGSRIKIVKTDASANAVTVATTSSQTILTSAGAVTSLTLATQGASVTLVSDGVGWI